MEKKVLNKIITNIILLICLISMSGFAQEMPVPANLQAALFKKIFSFNKTLQAKGNVEVAVLGGGSGEVVSAFKEVGLNVKAVDQVPPGASVVYVMPGATPPKQKGVFSISGVPSYVESGKVSVGVGIDGGKPKIIVHLAQLKAEGQEMSADLLNIAKVIQ